MVISVASNLVLDCGQGSWYRKQGLPVTGWSMTRGMLHNLVFSKDEVDTDQVSFRKVSRGRYDGRCLKIKVDVE
jgi:hypothetical protein